MTKHKLPVTLEENRKEKLEIVNRVKERGGPKYKWQVDLKTNTATLGSRELSFYTLQDNYFDLDFYRNAVEDTNLEEDKLLIEDAIFCIDQKIR